MASFQRFVFNFKMLFIIMKRIKLALGQITFLEKWVRSFRRIFLSIVSTCGSKHKYQIKLFTGFFSFLFHNVPKKLMKLLDSLGGTMILIPAWVRLGFLARSHNHGTQVKWSGRQDQCPWSYWSLFMMDIGKIGGISINKTIPGIT